ncbi:hypothetical protein STANM309S_02638 [Streptomyces tanashiensis]
MTDNTIIKLTAAEIAGKIRHRRAAAPRGPDDDVPASGRREKVHAFPP